jgi:hypothetical protein
MKKNYDFSKGKKNPYYKKLKGKKIELTEEVSFQLSDLVKEFKKTKSKNKASSSVRTESKVTKAKLS